ncbi:MAG: hypothetical protein A3G05_01855 [Candidatus Zambryskibacteria bacterium RIFCSPLOWO2_12_FULL_45_14]|uniref:Response regulatory domain-containing protein n=2 Tax=Candidatus Zambryskiibacteriota TaxID=1817925 RepID=A0A1G2UKU5_9BACT|nr:MAG: hypothetical protein A3H60_02880 [Candidatus Zambryskibacteria bacterium RIFCSPLOWO2_02_FULL_44_12b]OHB14095.1 MAG: hypothetical protein A3G05_01855 [Candidatus Zambryskibacteria bacterium RIFCSPLOWO2_12_FULL_45_14]
MKKVLLIDDDEVFLKTVIDALSAENYEVITAKDGEEGLQMAKKKKPDLILLDVLLPQIGGMNFLKIIKEDEELNKIPVLVASNLTSMSHVEEGVALGARGYIIKSDESLKTIVDTVKSIIPI